MDDFEDIELEDVDCLLDDDLDIGEIKLGDFDLDCQEMESDRYLPPRVVKYDNETFVKYKNAEDLVSNIEIKEHSRFDAFVSGSFVFGDFIEAFFVRNRIQTEELTISTLSLNEENVDSLRGLMDLGYVQKLNLVVSVYFYSHEKKGKIQYIYNTLDIEDRFQLAVVGMHTKTAHFKTKGGKHIVIHGSANLRSCGQVEEVILEENKELYDFYQDTFEKIIEKYKTINKPLINSKLFETIKN